MIGITGSRKTSMCTAMAQLFNRERLKVDAEFTSTACGIEQTLSKYGDAIVINDDFIVGETATEQVQTARKLQTLVRLCGNRGSKERMSFYLQDNKKTFFPIKGCCLLTGEQITGITSSISRMFITNIERDDVQNDLLAFYQENKWILPTYAYDFLQWCCYNYDKILEFIKSNYDKIRKLVKLKHPRYAEMYATFCIVVEVFWWYACERWSLTLNDGRDKITGERKRITIYGATRTEVVHKAQELIRQMEKGYSSSNIHVNFKEIAEEYLKEVRENHLTKQSTFDKTQSTIELHLFPMFGDMNILDMNVELLEDTLINFSKKTYLSGHKDNEVEKPYSYSTYKKVYEKLNQVLEFAKRKKYILMNPMVNVRKSTKDEYERRIYGNDYLEKRKKVHVFTDNEIEKLKTECFSTYSTGRYRHKHGIAMLFILNTGLRASEALALLWKDIDFEENTIDVNKTLAMVANRDENGNKMSGTKLIFQQPKTTSSKRILAMSEATKDYLKIMKEQNYFGEDSPIIANSWGGHVIPTDFEKYFYNIIKSAKIIANESISLHCLRHTFGSRFFESSQDLLLTSKVLGHASVAVTAEIYLHSREDKIKQAMEKFEI